MPNENVSEAVEEIKAILRKRDLAGVVFVSSPDNLQFLYEISPSWSCAFLEPCPRGEMLRIKSRRADYPSLGAQKECLESTIGVFAGIVDAIDQTREGFMIFITKISAHFKEVVSISRIEE